MNIIPQHARYTLYLFSVTLLIALIFVFFIEKGSGVLFVNNLNTPGLDWFFTHYTYLGSALTFIAILVISLFVRVNFTLMTLVVFASQGLLVQISKRLLFRHLMRPIAYFEDTNLLHLVEGVNMHHTKTFPSGHTATAFAAAVLLSLVIEKKWVTWICLSGAILVALSRLYLGQHFYVDVVTGAIIGSLCAYMGWKWIRNINKPRFHQPLIKF